MVLSRSQGGSAWGLWLLAVWALHGTSSAAPRQDAPTDPGAFTIQGRTYQLFSSGSGLRVELQDPLLGAGTLDMDAMYFYTVQDDPGEELPAVDEAVMIVHQLHLSFTDYELRADHAAIWGDRDAYQDWVSRSGSGDSSLRHGPALPPTKDRPPLQQSYHRVPARLRFDALHEIYAEGNLMWRQGTVNLVFAEALYLHLLEQRGVFRNSSVFSAGAFGGTPTPFHVQAAAIRLLGRQQLEARGARLSTCLYGRPHYVIQSGLTRVSLEPGPPKPDEHPLAGMDPTYVTSEDNHFAWEDMTLLPLPAFSADLTAGEFLPIRRARAGNSTQYGAYLQTLWADRIRSLGEDAHRWFGSDAPFDGEWNSYFDLYSRRGAALGPGLEYASPDNYQGEIGSYYIYDRAREDHTRLSQPEIGGTGDPLRRDIDHHNRGRVFTRNRIWPAEHFRVDSEVHYLSDEGFLEEYFEKEFKEEKEPESYVHVVRQEGTTRLRALYRNRLNRFDTQLDALPKGSFEQVAFPAAEIPYLGELLGMDHPAHLVITHATEAANLRRQPAEDLNLRSERIVRGDSFLEASTAVPLGPLAFTPFAAGRFTGYDRTARSGRSVGRVAASAGARAQLVAHNEFDVLAPALTIDGMRHVVIFDGGYENVYGVSRDPGEFIQLDAVDGVREFERYLLGFRNRLQTWRRSSIVDFVEADFELPLYPREDRDNPVRVDTSGRPRGRTAGPLRSDLSYRPGFTDPWVDGVTLRSEAETDLTTGSFDVWNAGVSWRPWDVALADVRYRVVKGRAAVVTGSLDWRLTEKWSAGYFQQADLKARDILEQRFLLRRYAHDFIFEMAFEYDAGERDASFSVNLLPLIFARPETQRYGSDSGQRPDLYDTW